MSRKMSHQQEVERRHINNGSWSPDHLDDNSYNARCSSEFKYSSRTLSASDINEKEKMRAVIYFKNKLHHTLDDSLVAIVSLYQSINVPSDLFEKVLDVYNILLRLDRRNETNTAISHLQSILNSENKLKLINEVISRKNR
jgi:hypothetical protein